MINASQRPCNPRQQLGRGIKLWVLGLGVPDSLIEASWRSVLYASKDMESQMGFTFGIRTQQGFPQKRGSWASFLWVPSYGSPKQRKGSHLWCEHIQLWVPGRPRHRIQTFIRVAKHILGLIPHSFQPSFFSTTSQVPRVFGFLERRIPGKNGEVAPRKMPVLRFARLVPASLAGFVKGTQLRPVGTYPQQPPVDSSLKAAPNHHRPYLGRDPIAFGSWGKRSPYS